MYDDFVMAEKTGGDGVPWFCVYLNVNHFTLSIKQLQSVFGFLYLSSEGLWGTASQETFEEARLQADVRDNSELNSENIRNSEIGKLFSQPLLCCDTDTSRQMKPP